MVNSNQDGPRAMILTAERLATAISSTELEKASTRDKYHRVEKAYRLGTYIPMEPAIPVQTAHRPAQTPENHRG